MSSGAPDGRVGLTVGPDRPASRPAIFPGRTHHDVFRAPEPADGVASFLG